MNKFFVYIATNKRNTVIYTGFTNNLSKRMYEHKYKLNPRSFTARYNIEKLVHIEVFKSRDEARFREEQIKKWRRSKKMALVEKENPNWVDYSNDFSLVL